MNLLLKDINWGSVGIVLAILAILALIFTILILVVNKVCFVQEDERITKVSENLAGANCGGCGYAGCADFAKALVEGKANLSDCGATSNESKEIIASVLNIPFAKGETKFAIVKCAGGINAKDKFEYVGNKGCDSQIAYLGGAKVCMEGCLGDGTCAINCKESAITVKDGVAIVDKSLCGACGACVLKCPKNLIELIPTTAKVYVACSSKCRGKDVLGACTVGCVGCGLCAKNCPEGAITMVDNLPVIDYKKCTGCKTCVLKCPRKTIKEI